MQGRRTNWSSLFFGLVFLGVAALLLTGQVGLVTSLRWAGPLLLIVIAICLIGWAVAERPRPMAGAPQAVARPGDSMAPGSPGDAGIWPVSGGPAAPSGQAAPGESEDPPSPVG